MEACFPTARDIVEPLAYTCRHQVERCLDGGTIKASVGPWFSRDTTNEAFVSSTMPRQFGSVILPTDGNFEKEDSVPKHVCSLHIIPVQGIPGTNKDPASHISGGVPPDHGN